jgi:hypothetical protein
MTTPAAGWYHDPSDSDAWRWWDGATWTAHVRPKEETAPVAVVAAAPPLAPEPAPEPVLAQPAQAAEPAPVAQPAPAEPAQPSQPARLTPETPASEQLYWHSANAEVVTIPGRSASSQHTDPRRSSAAPARALRVWGEVGSPHTAGIWLLAFLPIIASVLSSVAGLALQAVIGPNGAVTDPIGASQKSLAVLAGYVLVLTISAWAFAGNDIKTLRARGYEPPTIWWMLVPLSPLAYFIARGKVVRAEGKRAWPPELLFFLSIMIPIALGVLATIFAASVLASLAGTAGVPL